MNQQDRRKDNSFDEQKAYKAKDLSKQIETERRADNLEKLMEVKQQKNVYNLTLAFCLFLNALLLALGIIGLGGN